MVPTVGAMGVSWIRPRRPDVSGAPLLSADPSGTSWRWPPRSLIHEDHERHGRRPCLAAGRHPDPHRTGRDLDGRRPGSDRPARGPGREFRGRRSQRPRQAGASSAMPAGGRARCPRRRPPPSPCRCGGGSRPETRSPGPPGPNRPGGAGRNLPRTSWAAFPIVGRERPRLRRGDFLDDRSYATPRRPPAPGRRRRLRPAPRQPPGRKLGSRVGRVLGVLPAHLWHGDHSTHFARHPTVATPLVG